MEKRNPKSNVAKHEIRPASSEEAGLFYALPPERDEELGAIGHVRIDFGRRGDRFYHTWHPRGPEELNTQGFKDELTEVVDELRASVLKDLASMRAFCGSHGGVIQDGWPRNYGYVIDTDRYLYRLRCNPIEGDYQAYLTCFDKQAQKQALGLTEKGRQALLGAADPGKAHTYSWYVIENINTPELRMDHDLPLEEAIRLYAGLDCEDKRLGVTKDGIVAADLLIRWEGREWLSEVRLKLDSFKDDPVVADAAARLQQMLEAAPKKIQGEEQPERSGPLEIRSLADLKRAIKPGAEMIATYHAYHPETVGLVRVVTEVHTNAFYSKIKDQPDHELSNCNHGRGFRTDFEKASCYQFDGPTIRVLNSRKNDGSVLFEFEVYVPEMRMDAQEETGESPTMTMGGMS